MHKTCAVVEVNLGMGYILLSETLHYIDHKTHAVVEVNLGMGYILLSETLHYIDHKTCSC